nr:hypothetical protein [uncultured Rhodopila sp.]
MEHPALTHIEKTLAEAYRKEIDQEENVWRSLPFFAATLALQLAAIFQVITRLPPMGTVAGWASAVAMGLTGLLMAVALVLLAACITPRKMQHVADETALLRFAEALIQAEQDESPPGRQISSDGASSLKRKLCEQYAVATEYNRSIRRRRDKLRAYAGLCVLASVMTTLLLVTAASVHYFPRWSNAGGGHGPACEG